MRSDKQAVAKAGRLSMWQKARTILALLLVAAALAVVLVPTYRAAATARVSEAYGFLRCLVVACEHSVHRVDALASSNRRLAERVIDDEYTNYWEAENSDNEWLCIDFAERVTVTRVGVYLGNPEGDPSDFGSTPHPSWLEIIPRRHLCSVRASLRTRTRDDIEHMELENIAEEQFHNVGFDSVRSVKLIIRDIHPGRNGEMTSPAVAEVEFFAKN